MEVKVNSNMDRAMRGLWNVKTKYIQKALTTSLNKVGAEVFTQAKKELAGATGLKQNVVAKKIKKIRHARVMKHIQFILNHAT